MLPLKHERFFSQQVVNLLRFEVVNFSRSEVVSLNRNEVVNFVGFSTKYEKEIAFKVYRIGNRKRYKISELIRFINGGSNRCLFFLYKLALNISP